MTELNTITVLGEAGQPVVMFQASSDRIAAANIWVYLVENFRPGLTVELSLPGLGVLSQETAVKVSPERYAAIMNQEEAAFGQPEKVTR